MKPFALIAISIFLLTSCGEQQSKSNAAASEAAQGAESNGGDEMRSGEGANSGNQYPEALNRVFKAHGGLDAWKAQRTLTYVMPKETLSETHTIDLKTREDRIDTDAYSIGFDGERTWILDPDGTYDGNPEFYHNLMFYFYAMPFVLADPGINYGSAPDLEFEGKAYPGIRISYGEGVGITPEDEYYLHYDPDTGQMAWLGYTVTYRTGEPSDNVKWIRYDNWQPVEGVLLPASISWYDYKGRQIGDRRNTVPFEQVSLEETARPDGFYQKPEGAEFFKKEE